MSLVIAGIHTGIGKTVCSAIICQKLGYDYFKPVQAGDLENSDSIFVKNQVTNPSCKILTERYRLQLPASPHYSAALEGIEIKLEAIQIPEGSDKLLIETAGGVMSPLSDSLTNLDLIAYLKMPVILVSRNYLGSINHTLCSYLALKSKNIKMAGIVFNGPETKASEEYILNYTGLPRLFSIPDFEKIDAETIRDFASKLIVDL